MTAVVAFLVGAYARPFLAESSTTSKSSDAKVGRYALVISPLVKNEKYLVDTQTGKIWQVAKPGEETDKAIVSHHIDKPVIKEKMIVKEQPIAKTSFDAPTVEMITS